MKRLRAGVRHKFVRPLLEGGGLLRQGDVFASAKLIEGVRKVFEDDSP